MKENNPKTDDCAAEPDKLSHQRDQPEIDSPMNEQQEKKPGGSREDAHPEKGNKPLP